MAKATLPFELDIDKIAAIISKNGYDAIILQLPDGIKQFATSIVDELNKKIKHKCAIFIWLNTCYGFCDLALNAVNMLKQKYSKIALIQFGHTEKHFEFMLEQFNLNIVKI